MATIRVIDSHTGGEPTRLVIEGGPELGDGPASGAAAALSRAFRSLSLRDRERAAGVGCSGRRAALSSRIGRDCDFGVIFFNNVGYLGMCGHGTIGLIASLRRAGRLAPGADQDRHPGGSRRRASCTRTVASSVVNVASYRSAPGVTVTLPGIGADGAAMSPGAGTGFF